MKPSVVSVILAILLARVQSRCVTHGACDYTSGAPCQKDTYPILMDDPEAQQKFTSMCPEAAAHLAAGGWKTCCSAQQIDLAKQDFGLELAEAMLGQCPSCVRNIKQLMCNIVCSPNQSSFMKVDETKESNDAPGSIQVLKMTVHVTKSFAEDSYQSCKDIISSMTDTLAMDWMCGRWGSNNCTADRWFDYMGNNPFSPFTTTYKISDNKVGNFVPLNSRMIPCNLQPTPDTAACNCQDCPASCSGH